MQKIVVAFVILAGFWMGGFQRAEAQGLPACTEEELSATLEGLAAYSAEIENLGDLSSDPNDAAYGAVLVGYDAFSYAFWSTVYPEVPACVEAQSAAYAFGLMYDEMATAAAFANLGGWMAVAEDAEATQYFVDAATVRIEEVNAIMEAMTTDGIEVLLSETLPACSAEELEANTAALGEYFTGMNEQMMQMSAESTDDVANLASIVVIVDGFATTFWEEVYLELPACAEADLDAYVAGRVLDQLVLTSTLALNGVLESEGGNTEVAQALVDSATTRQAELEALLADMTWMGDQ